MIHPFNQFTNALKIDKPSLYSAFGNKENLFNKAIDLYSNKYGLYSRFLKVSNNS